ncbi:MAG: response regulator, partial [Cyanobacteria bacterium J06648_11]
MIVDDNATNRQILTLQARSWGMTPHAVPSGAAALAWLREGQTLHLAILDMQMPTMDGVTLARTLRQLPAYRELPLIVLSSMGATACELEARDINFAAFLTKPAKQALLCDTIANALGGSRNVARSLQASTIDARLAERLPLKLLLAEDNPVNQKVALRLLARLGYDADVAGNGVEVLEALRRQSYDAILMDVQMPQMDGLEATRRITHEWQDPAERPRIIAMTANAMQGDRERCLQAGMDDYISKPVRLESLQAVLEQWGSELRSQKFATLDRPHDDSAVNAATTHAPISAPVQLETVLERDRLDDIAAGDAELEKEMLELYCSDSRHLLQASRRAIWDRDFGQVERSMHQLKGSSGNLGAIAVAAASERVVAVVRAGD